MKHRSSLNNRIDRWLAGRPWRLLWLCLPALIALGVLLLTLILVLSQHTTELNSRYDRLVQFLLATHKFEEARVASLHGLAEVKDDREREQKLFYLALALDGLGQKQEAAQLMNVVAPLDHPGCADAHLMMARSLLSSTNLASDVLSGAPLNATNATTEALHKIERHLLNALALEPQSLEANELLGRFYIIAHNPAKAQKCLLKIYSAKSDTANIALLLAFSCVQTNDQAGALQWADRAIIAYEQNMIKSAPHYLAGDLHGLNQALLVKRMYAPVKPATTSLAKSDTNAPPHDNTGFWMGIVRLLLVNGKYAPALQTLEQQMHDNPNPIYASAIAEICASMAGGIPSAQKGGSARRLQLIQEGLANASMGLTNAQYDQTLLTLQLLLAQASHATDETGPEAKKLLDEAVASATNNESAAQWQFVLWTDARLRGDLAAGRPHLRTAYQLAPQIPQIKNDMALDLSTGSREDVERALKLIQSLVDQFPYQPSLRDTRGRILAKLGRNQEALSDLEFAVSRLRNPQGARQVLAKVYAALGRTPPVPQAHPAALLEQARSLADQRKYAEALAKLEPEMRQSPNDAYASAIADICAAWAEQMPANQGAERLRLIQKGLGYDPQHSALMVMLLQATHAAGDSGPAAQKLLDQLVASAFGDAAAEWHLFLGQDARSRGDLPASRRQLQTAYQLAPERTDIKSQLAWALVNGNQDDWNQGLQLIQPAVDQFPDSPEFRNIRGLLLARLGQNKAAVADLEYAVSKLPDPAPETRMALAKAYEALGKSHLAEQQRRLAATARKP